MIRLNQNKNHKNGIYSFDILLLHNISIPNEWKNSYLMN